MLFTETITAQKRQLNVMLWKLAAELPEPNGLAGAITGVSNDVLIVAGGNNFPDSMPWLGGKKKYYGNVYVFSKQHDTLMLNNKKWSLPFALAYAAVCTSAYGIAYAGGENEQGISKKAGLLVWDKSLGNLLQQSLPDLPMPLTNASAAAYGGQLYIAGGETSNGVSDHLYMLDLADTTGGWKQLPSVPASLSHSLAVVQSNGQHDCLYLLGGRKKNSYGVSDLYATVFSFDFVTSRWQQKKSLPYHLSAAAGVARGNHTILIFGGDKGTTFHQTETLLTAIAGETDADKKQTLNAQKIRLQSDHPGFSGDILEYNTMTSASIITGFIPFDAPVTTQAFFWGNEIVIPGGEIKAGVRTGNILTGYFKNRQ